MQYIFFWSAAPEQNVAETIELLRREVEDFDASFLHRAAQPHARSPAAGEFLLEAFPVQIRRAALRAAFRFPAGPHSRSVSRTDRPRRSTVSQIADACSGGAERSARACPARVARRHRLADRGWQLEEPHGVGHRGAVLPYPLGHLLLGEGEVVRKTLVPLGELDGVQIRPLDVFHQRGFERLPVREPAHHRREDGKPAASAARNRRSPATSSYPSGVGRTSTGWRTPFSRIEAASSSSASGEKVLLGWRISRADFPHRIRRNPGGCPYRGLPR